MAQIELLQPTEKIKDSYGKINTSLTNLNSIVENTSIVLPKIENKYEQYAITPGVGYVSFVDDDGHIDAFNVLKPIFDARGKKFTLAIITSYPDNNPDYMTWDQIKQMHDEGYEIISHTHNHVRLSTLTDAKQIFEMEESKRVLMRHGIMPNHIAYPFGDYNNFTLDNVLRYYKSGIATRISAQQNGLIPPLNTTRISRIHLGSYQDLTTEEIKNRILTAHANGRWVVLMTHAWANNAENPPEGNIAAITDVLDFCVNNNINVVTYDEGFRRYCNRLEIGNNSISGRGYYIVGADLQEYTNIDALKNRVMFLSAAVNGTEPPSFFPSGMVTYCEIPGVRASNMPGARAGTLITERFGPNLGYVKQTYKHWGRTDVFIRSGQDDDTWTAWVRVSTTTV